MKKILIFLFFMYQSLILHAQWVEGDGVISTGNSIGIGLTNPSTKLHIHDGAIKFSFTKADSNLGNDALYDGLHFTTDNESVYSSIKLYRGQWSSHLGFRIQTMYGVDNPINALEICPNGNIGIGTKSPGNNKLAVDGAIVAKEIKVEASGWSDFVFEENYELKSLAEVESFISDNKHLPDVPNEAEIKDSGINLGEMDATLLRKIEELTLYLIQQNREIEVLKQEIEDLKGGK